MLPRNCPAVPNNHHWWGSPAKYLQATSNEMVRKKRPSWGGPLRPLTPDGGLHLVAAFLRSISPRTEARVSFQRRVGPGQQAIQIERPSRVHFQTLSRLLARSVDPPIADMGRLHQHVGFVPNPETVRAAWGIACRGC